MASVAHNCGSVLADDRTEAVEASQLYRDSAARASRPPSGEEAEQEAGQKIDLGPVSGAFCRGVGSLGVSGIPDSLHI